MANLLLIRDVSTKKENQQMGYRAEYQFIFDDGTDRIVAVLEPNDWMSGDRGLIRRRLIEAELDADTVEEYFDSFFKWCNNEYWTSLGCWWAYGATGRPPEGFKLPQVKK